MSFKVHTIESAPAQSGKVLDQESNLGFVLNLIGVFAESPEILQAYLEPDRLRANSNQLRAGCYTLLTFSTSRSLRAAFRLSVSGRSETTNTADRPL